MMVFMRAAQADYFEFRFTLLLLKKKFLENFSAQLGRHARIMPLLEGMTM